TRPRETNKARLATFGGSIRLAIKHITLLLEQLEVSSRPLGTAICSSSTAVQAGMMHPASTMTSQVI
ncbi:MAG: hypothetical protein WCF35_13005, partial [Pseudolabrys sp.]